MNSIWNITIDDYIAVCEIAKANGVQPGESMEKYFIAYMKAKGIKPVGHTELSNKELIEEYKSHGKNVLNMKTDEEGKTTYET